MHRLLPSREDCDTDRCHERDDDDEAHRDERLEEVAHTDAFGVAPVIRRAGLRGRAAHGFDEEAEGDDPEEEEKGVEDYDVERRQPAAAEEDGGYEEV